MQREASKLGGDQLELVQLKLLSRQVPVVMLLKFSNSVDGVQVNSVAMIDCGT